MSCQRAPGIYVPMLIPRGHGYPLWVPRPHADSPIMNRGIDIGDLGYLADDGSFVFLFNVCHDAEDEVNREGVPPGFVPLRVPDNGTLTDPERYTKNSAILSYGMKKKSISLDISASVPCKGAVLVLPDGGGSYDSKHLGLFEEYGAAHALSWFEYFNGPTQRRQIRSGMLYLVTGCDKCHSWANTCFSTQSGGVSLKLLASAGAGQFTGISGYTWEVQNDEPVNSYVAPRDLTNQTVFVRGYSISIRDRLSRTLGSKSVEVTMIGAMNNKPPRIGTSVPFESSTTPTTVTDLGTQVSSLFSFYKS
ncbi:hypothetical protein ARMGADRAFT_935625 [Armillaria gallica]|uniref:Uncharacterized protein n=1 Tax=Armillaria gallica TaxID=47427 RepID=A0A2H3D360_ARMGA|nr:hypothetical protein ARMGADRAFT_935625 [Armillaria gallica]